MIEDSDDFFEKYKPAIPKQWYADGSMDMEHAEKCDYISKLAEKYTVLSAVGSKDANVIIPPYKWIKLMKAEFEAGSW